MKVFHISIKLVIQTKFGGSFLWNVRQLSNGGAEAGHVTAASTNERRRAGDAAGARGGATAAGRPRPAACLQSAARTLWGNLSCSSPALGPSCAVLCFTILKFYSWNWW